MACVCAPFAVIKMLFAMLVLLFFFFTAKKKQYQHRVSGIKMLFAMLVLLFPPPFLFSILGHHDAVGDVDSAFSLSRNPAP